MGRSIGWWNQMLGEKSNKICVSFASSLLIIEWPLTVSSTRPVLSRENRQVKIQ